MSPIVHSDNSLPGSTVEISGATHLKDVLTHLKGNVAWFKLEQPNGYVSGNEIFELVKSGAWKELEDKSIAALIEDPHVNVWLAPTNKSMTISTPPRVYQCKNKPPHANSKPKPRCDFCSFPVLDE
jgi:hypothetical protein